MSDSISSALFPSVIPSAVVEGLAAPALSTLPSAASDDILSHALHPVCVTVCTPSEPSESVSSDEEFDEDEECDEDDESPSNDVTVFTSPIFGPGVHDCKHSDAMHSSAIMHLPLGKSFLVICASEKTRPSHVRIISKVFATVEAAVKAIAGKNKQIRDFKHDYTIKSGGGKAGNRVVSEPQIFIAMIYLEPSILMCEARLLTEDGFESLFLSSENNGDDKEIDTDMLGPQFGTKRTRKE